MPGHVAVVAVVKHVGKRYQSNARLPWCPCIGTPLLSTPALTIPPCEEWLWSSMLGEGIRAMLAFPGALHYHNCC